MNEMIGHYPPPAEGIPLGLPENRRRLAYSIKAAIAYRKVTAADVARAMGVSPNTIGRWTTGQTVPDAIDIGLLGDVLGVRPVFFADPPPIPEYPLRDYLLRPSSSDASGE